MNQFIFEPLSKITLKNTTINVFEIGNDNIDNETVDSFGEEWSKFSNFSDAEIANAGNQYFDIVNEEMLNKNSLVLDMGCGTGRWTKFIAPKVKFVEAIDPSKAVLSAADLLKENGNVRITQASVANIPFATESFDFVFSLGVLHHIPDTQLAMQQTVEKLRKGGYFLVYLYYNLDNRGILYKALFTTSIIFRKIISKLPSQIKKFVCDLIALFVYLPFVIISSFFRILGLKKLASKIPLSYYCDKSFNIIRNDSLDRFGTPLEQRFSKLEILKMMENCGLTDIKFSENEPFWHATGKKI